MITLRQNDDEIRIRQTPLGVYAVGVVFTLPLVWSALTQLNMQADAAPECLFIFVGGLWYILLDIVGLREEIIINRASQTFYRRVQGLFRRKEQYIPLGAVRGIRLETRPDKYGTEYKYLYLQSDVGDEQINNHYLIRNEHRRVGQIISSFLNIPLEICDDAGLSQG